MKLLRLVIAFIQMCIQSQVEIYPKGTNILTTSLYLPLQGYIGPLTSYEPKCSKYGFKDYDMQ